MKVTGHRSVDGIRSYKQVNDKQFKGISEALQNQGNKENMEQQVKKEGIKFSSGILCLISKF